VRLHRLKLVNFRQHADTEIEFGDGITAIIGPNGSGKTTLLEAIAWAFYGTSAARGNRESLRWNRAAARSPVKVEVEFTLGAHEYVVARTLYGAELFQDRASQAVANSQQEVTAWMQRLLGMTREEFFNTYFTGQKELTVMAAMGPTERAKFLSRVLGYEKLRDAQDRLRAARSELRGELAGLERALDDRETLEREREAAATRRQEAAGAAAVARDAHARAVEARDAARPGWEALEGRRATALSLDGERRLAEQKVEEARREFDRLDRELAEALAARTALETLAPTLADLEPLRAELDRLEKEARAAGRRQTLRGELAAV
jgi:DNA repair protein SbcC/Rad50